MERMKRYVWILVHRPYLILGFVLIIAITCLAVIFSIGEWPDFSDPRLGFEARGTEIAKRMLSYDHLIKNTDCYVNLTPKSKRSTLVASARRMKDNGTDEEHGFYRNSSNAMYFCDIPREEYAQIVFSHRDKDTLFSVGNIHSMCSVENAFLRSTDAFRDVCIHNLYSQECCRSWSLGNYIAFLAAKSSCLDVTSEDVNATLGLLQRCSTYFHNGTLASNCGSENEDVKPAGCQFVPEECTKSNAVYFILHFLTDTEFLQNQTGELNMNLRYSVTFLPIAAGIGTKPLYREIQEHTLEKNGVKLIALNFGVKENLFYYHLQKDAVWFAVAGVCIFLLMWIYTCSIFVTAMTLVSMMISLVIAYVIYTFIYQIEFFPFKNLLAIVILLGIGADDLFVYIHTWESLKKKKNTGPLQQIVSDTIKHATLSMFVTSLTTSAAFFASYISQITAVSCFALFAGTVVITNFLVMMTWIPATIVIKEKWTLHCTSNRSECTAKSKSCMTKFCTFLSHVYKSVSSIIRRVFDVFLAFLVCKLPYLWLVLLGAFGVGGIIVTFYHPKLKLPSSNDFQVFSSDHPFEVYDFVVKDHLWFGKSAGSIFAYMPLVVVWGVKAADNGNKLDPFDEGTIEYDQDFNVATPEAQLWFRDFCRNLRSNDLYQKEFGLHLTDCFIESFIRFMKRGCRSFDEEDLSPCCGNPSFPYPENVFNQCILQWLPLLGKDNPFYTINRKSGLRFTKDSQQLVSAVVFYSSKVPYSMNYQSMQTFYQTMNDWATAQILEAPSGLRRGWFISDLEFFDLQDTIAQGTPVAIGVAISIAFVVTFLTTLNIFITIYAIVSISLVIFSTVGSLILLGWELNILEAVTMSVAVGLSIDFTLHYGVAYSLAPTHDRTGRVAHSLTSMGSPVGMAALTTFLAGALVMPSTVLAYRQLGTFLMLVMVASWLYGSFFFLSILRVIGPEGGSGQLHWPTCCCSCSCGCCERVCTERTLQSMSESTSSTPNIALSSPQDSELSHLNQQDSKDQEFL